MTAGASGCTRVEQAISARVDGEDPALSAELLDAHLARCGPCAAFSAWADAEHRRTRIRAAGTVPDLSERLAAAIPLGAAPRPSLLSRRAWPAPRPSLLSRRAWPAPHLGTAAVVALVAAGGFVVGAHLVANDPASPSGAAQMAGAAHTNPHYPGATVLPRSIAKPNLTLTDTGGQPYDLAANTPDRVTLVYFGYTHCPDVCPINMAVTAAALERMPAKQRSEVTVVFITTDPSRDTPAVIRTWLDRFNPAFVGLTGTRSQIQHVEKDIAMPLSYAEAVSTHPGNYQMVHAAYTLIYSQDNLAHLTVDVTETPPAYATTLERVVTAGPPTS